MATTTPLNGWPVPTSTDYVKDGATSIEALGDAIDTSVGEGLLPWKTWAPTLSGGWANGNGIYAAKYVQIGKTVHLNIYFAVGSTTTKGTGMTLSLPVTAASNTANTAGIAWCTVAGSVYVGSARLATATAMVVQQNDAAGTYVRAAATTATIPATWATGNNFFINLTYQAA
jgi:hypothetical protein